MNDKMSQGCIPLYEPPHPEEQVGHLQSIFKIKDLS
jgi:hypothetical protein